MTTSSAQHLIATLHARARRRQPGGKLVINPDAVRCLLDNWRVAERAGVRLHPEGVFVNGVLFVVGREPAGEQPDSSMPGDSTPPPLTPLDSNVVTETVSAS